MPMARKSPVWRKRCRSTTRTSQSGPPRADTSTWSIADAGGAILLPVSIKWETSNPMTKFQFPESIRSRPVYGTLEPRPGKAHLMIADAEGAEALLDLASADAGLVRHAHIIYIPKGTGETYVERLRALDPEQLHVSPSFDASLPRLRRVLAEAHMG